MRERLARDASYSLDALDADMGLMVANAHTYNAPDSQVYIDASTLANKYAEAKKKLGAGGAGAEP